jgi:hypothetical protein
MSRVDPSAQKQPTCVDDVRRVREDLSARFGNDVYKLGDYLRKVGEEYREELGLKTARDRLVGDKPPRD